MLIRSHLTITIFFVLLLLDKVESKFIFVIVALMATYIPDIDSKKSKLGKYILFRPLQWFTKHRGIFHSFSFLIVVGFVLYLFFPYSFLFGFVLGYGSHLLVDCLTVQGIRIFYPLKFRVRGFIRSGGIIETIIFVVFLFLDFGWVVWKLIQI